MNEPLICKMCGGDKKRRRGEVCANCSHANSRLKHRRKAALAERLRYSANKEKAANRVKAWNLKNKEWRRKYAKARYDKMLADSPNAIKAKNAVMRAYRSSALTRLPCKICGELKTDAHHHESYEPKDWLNVIFLCRKHHRAWHRVFTIN